MIQTDNTPELSPQNSQQAPKTAGDDNMLRIANSIGNITKRFSATIVTALLSVMVVLVSMYTFSQQEGASLAAMFSDAWAAILSCVRIVLPPIITVLMSFNFMHTAYKNANEIEEVREWRGKYEAALSKTHESRVVRPERDRKISKGKTVLTKGLTALLTGIMTTQLLIEMQIVGLVAALIQLGIALGLGFYTYTSTYSKETDTYLSAYKYWLKVWEGKNEDKVLQKSGDTIQPENNSNSRNVIKLD